MTLEASFAELGLKLNRLERTCDDLLWAVVQAQPTWEIGHALVDRYDAATHDVAGLAKEMRQAVQGVDVVTYRLDLEGARQALTLCQGQFNEISNRFYSEHVSFEWLDDLRNLTRMRGGEWAIWVQGVQDALSQCPPTLYDVNQTLFCCWQDLVERAFRLT